MREERKEGGRNEGGKGGREWGRGREGESEEERERRKEGERGRG